VLFSVYGAIATRMRGMEFLVLGILVTLGGQIVNRLLIQTTVTNEARFTFPIIVLFIPLLGMLLERFSTDPKWMAPKTIGDLLVNLFTGMSLLFIITFMH
jgi:hypothetical protein